MFVLKQSPLSCSQSAAASHTVKKRTARRSVFTSETLSQEGAGVACGGASQSQLGVCKYMHDAPSYSLPRGLTRIVKDSKTRQEPNRRLFKSCFSRLLRLSAGPSSQITQMYKKKKKRITPTLPDRDLCWGQSTPGSRWRTHRTGSCGSRWLSSNTSKCCCWRWCRRRTNPLQHKHECQDAEGTVLTTVPGWKGPIKTSPDHSRVFLRPNTPSVKS